MRSIFWASPGSRNDHRNCLQKIESWKMLMSTSWVELTLELAPVSDWWNRVGPQMPSAHPHWNRFSRRGNRLEIQTENEHQNLCYALWVLIEFRPMRASQLSKQFMSCAHGQWATHLLPFCSGPRPCTGSAPHPGDHGATVDSPQDIQCLQLNKSIC